MKIMDTVKTYVEENADIFNVNLKDLKDFDVSFKLMQNAMKRALTVSDKVAVWDDLQYKMDQCIYTCSQTIATFASSIGFEKAFEMQKDLSEKLLKDELDASGVLAWIA